MGKRIFCLSITTLMIFCFTIISYAEERSGDFTVYLAGDSTVKTYLDTVSYGGWGQYLKDYLDDSATVSNHSIGGRSSRQFINEGTLDTILKEIQPGDYLFIQFGHNDAANIEDLDAYGRKIARLERSVALGVPDENGIYPVTPMQKIPMDEIDLEEFNMKDNAYIELLQSRRLYTYGEYYYPYELTKDGVTTRGTYKWYLSRYIEAAQELGATPVVVTPLVRRFFDDEGKIEPHHYDSQNKGIVFPYINDGYVDAAIQIANEYNVPYIDLYTKSKEYYEELGIEGTTLLNLYRTDGAVDTSHQNKFGAFVVTSILVDELKKLDIPLAAHIVPPDINPPKRQLVVEPADSFINTSKQWDFSTKYFSDHFKNNLSDLVGGSRTADGLKFVANVHKKISFDNTKEINGDLNLKGCVTIAHSGFDSARIEIPVKKNCEIKIMAAGKAGREIILGEGVAAKQISNIAMTGENTLVTLSYEYKGSNETLSVYTKGGAVDIYQIEVTY